MAYTLGRLCQNEIIRALVLFIEDAVSLTCERNDLFERRRAGYFKKNDNITEYQNPETVFNRVAPDDRVFPFETVELQSFNQKHDTSIEYASIHVGGFADELTRSLNVLALTIGSDIFFRSDNYNTSSTEGRKILAHELTHVSQYEEKDINELKNREQLEKEAENAEAEEEEFEIDPIITTKFNGKSIRIRKSRKKEIIRNTVDELVRYVEQQKYVLEEEKYLKFLCFLQEYCESSFFTVVKNKNGYDMAQEIEDTFKAGIIRF
jgi:hypothetical protein